MYKSISDIGLDWCKIADTPISIILIFNVSILILQYSIFLYIVTYC